MFLGTRTGQRPSARRWSAAKRLVSLGGIAVFTVTGVPPVPGFEASPGAAATTPGPAMADPVPDARDVDQARRRAEERADEVARTKVRFAQATGELDRLAAAAALAVERYNGEQVKLARAAAAYRDALTRLAEAERRHSQVRSNLAAFAAEAYQANTGYNAWPSVVAGGDGPQGFMDRAGLLEVLARRRTGLLQALEAARNVAGVFRAQAQSALAEQNAATRRAMRARQMAEQAVQRQQEAVREIGAEKRRLERELGIARERADDLARQRRQAVASANATRVDLEGSHAQGSAVVRAALRWLGTPYSWGGGTVRGPSYGIAHGSRIHGFDCSGLAMYAWAKAGVQLDHWTGTQWTSGPHIPLNRLRPGDLVFYAYNTADPDTIHHVGLFIGKGRMVEAPYTGGRVRISSIWRPGLIGATRPDR
ncbi:C40 family peptidase [Actinomadura miaoliensis]|uniref:C40 family peptidase n=1 Tax=Actinomadura miaoliensis TaxID=430685 RepID=UPI0031ED0743